MEIIKRKPKTYNLRKQDNGDGTKEKEDRTQGRKRITGREGVGRKLRPLSDVVEGREWDKMIKGRRQGRRDWQEMETDGHVRGPPTREWRTRLEEGVVRGGKKNKNKRMKKGEFGEIQEGQNRKRDLEASCRTGQFMRLIVFSNGGTERTGEVSLGQRSFV